MTGPLPTQLEMLRLAPELARAAQLHRLILTLTHAALDVQQQDTLRRLLGELASATWNDGYQARHQEAQL